MIWTVGFFFFLGGCGAFFLARQLTGSTWFGLFGTLLFLLTPYVECNVYVRGDLSEFAAMMLTPWPLFFLGLVKRRVGRSGLPGVLPFLALTVSLAAIIVTHPATAMFYMGVFTVMVWACRETGAYARSFYWWVGLGLVSALVLSSPYWLTFWWMKGLVDFVPVSDGWYHPTRHLFNLKPLFNSEWRYGDSPWGLPLHLGWPHFLLALTGAFAGWRAPYIRVALLTYLGLVTAMTYIGYPLWKFLPLLNYVQFPWRLLSVIGVLQVVCACGLARTKLITSGAMRASLLLVLAVGVSFSARNQFQFERIFEIERDDIISLSVPPFLEFEHLSAEDDFLPKTVKITPVQPRQDESMVHPQERSEVDLEGLPGHSPYHIRVGFQTGADPAVVVIDQFGFPGMRVTLSGTSTPATGVVPDLLADGRMTVTLPADTRGVLEAYYDGPPGWRFHRAFILLWFAGLSGASLFLHRRGKAGPGSGAGTIRHLFTSAAELADKTKRRVHSPSTRR
jgi:hypothetical protein